VKPTSTVHLGRKVGAILLRDVWTDTAEVLLHMVSLYGQLLSGLYSYNDDVCRYVMCKIQVSNGKGNSFIKLLF